MTIFYFFYEYISEGLGGLSHVWEVSRHLHKQKYRIIIFAPTCRKYRPKSPVEIIYVPTIDIRFLRFISFHFLLFFYAAYHMLHHRVDIIYVREMALSLTPLVLAKIFKKPMITEINGDLLSEYESLGYSQFSLSAMRFVERIVCRSSQALVCVTEGLRNIFEARYQLLNENIWVIPNGTDTDCFKPLDLNICRQRLGLNLGIKLVGFVGTFVPHQGLADLIKSSTLILEESPDVVFLLVGDGPMRQNLIEMIQAIDVADHFILPGAVPKEDAVNYINAMDVCLAPFTRRRNERIGLSPLKIYDYMACGKPIVASDIAGVGDLLRENGVGITITPEDPTSLARGVLLALNDKGLQARCLEKGPIIIKQNHTWQITAQKVANVCIQVLAQQMIH